MTVTTDYKYILDTKLWQFIDNDVTDKIKVTEYNWKVSYHNHSVQKEVEPI